MSAAAVISRAVRSSASHSTPTEIRSIDGGQTSGDSTIKRDSKTFSELVKGLDLVIKEDIADLTYSLLSIGLY